MLWGGWPFFERGWASIVTRRLNMFTLIALGTGAAYVYSLVAALAPGIFPTSFRDPDGQVPLYFEAAAVIVTLVLLGQVLELRARSQTSNAIPTCRSRLVPELTVFSAQADDDRTTYVGGVADALAYLPLGIIDLVIDWKTDISPSVQQVDLYREQMRYYLAATGASEGLLVFVTTGRLVCVQPAFQPTANAT